MVNRRAVEARGRRGVETYREETMEFYSVLVSGRRSAGGARESCLNRNPPPSLVVVRKCESS